MNTYPPFNEPTPEQRELEAIARDSCAYDEDRIHAVERIDDLDVLREVAASSQGAVATAAEYQVNLLDDWDD